MKNNQDFADLSAPLEHTPNGMWILLAYLWAAAAVTARIWWEPPSIMLLSLFGTLFTYGVNRALALYPRPEFPARAASLTFLVCIFLFCDAAGQVGFHTQWRRSFQLNGPWINAAEPSEGWSVTIPAKWVRRQEQHQQSTTTFFTPSRLTPTIEFTLTRQPGTPAADARALADEFLAKLPDAGRTQLLDGRWVPYGARTGYRIIYQDPGSALVLRHAMIFLLDGEMVYAISVTALPAWHERFEKDFDRYLNSLTLPGRPPA